MIYPETRYLVAGDQWLTIEIGDEISLELNFKVIALDNAVKEAKIPGLIETLPTYRSLLVHFDNLKIEMQALIQAIKEVEKGVGGMTSIPSRLVELPVRYGGRWGKDLEYVAEINGLSVEETIKAHSDYPHWTGIVGFTPGLPFLVSLTPGKRLTAPKYEVVRTYTPEGTIGLGGTITSIYSTANPGGYQMLGLTPVPIYDPFQGLLREFEENPVLLRMGDRVKFNPIDDAELDFTRQQIREGSYRIKIADEMFSI